MFILFFVLTACTTAIAGDLKSKYATIVYKNDAQLRSFNQELNIGKLSYYIKDTAETVHDEIILKIDAIISRVQKILDMRPEDLHFIVLLLDTKKEVLESYKKMYGNESGYIAFYSVGKNTVYVSIENTELKIIAHEIGHAIIENYFEVSPPRKIHEVLAQFAESHILD